MRLVSSKNMLNIEMIENMVNVLVIENPRVMSDIVQELYCQYNGGAETFVLSEDNKVLKLDKEVCLILEPFSLNCNEKKIISKLYQEIEMHMIEEKMERTININAQILSYIEEACNQVSYSLEYQSNVSIIDLLKLVSLRIRTDAETMVERIIEYISMFKNVNNSKVFIFLNLKLLLSTEDICGLYKYAINNKLFLLLFEGNISQKQENEIITLIDRDRCIVVS